LSQPTVRFAISELRRAIACALLVCTVAGCEVDSGPEPVDYFVPDHVLEIEITLDPDDWDTLRGQTRSFVSEFGGENCLDEPFGSPFTYFEGTVSVDGVELGRVGVRKKGFLGSLDRNRPSLKLKFDEFIEGQLLFGTERMTLNNARQDPAYVNQCMGYGIFANAGVPTPRCNFAHVTVNGVDMGIYVHVEDVKKRFLRRHFEDDEGDLYEGTVSDFREGWVNTFEQKTNREVPSDRARLQAVIDALAPGAPPEALAGLIDVEEFTTFWATEHMIGHWDGYSGNTNNYFVYLDPTDDLFHFIPWGVDAVLDERTSINGGTPPAIAVPVALGSAISLHLWALPDGRARYEARLRELLDTVFDEDMLLAELDRMEALIRPYLLPRDMARGFDEALAARRAFILDRRARLEEGLAAPVEVPAARAPFCLVQSGTITGTFETTHGSLGVENPFSHSATVEGMINDAPVAFTAVGAGAGFDSQDPSITTTVVFGQGSSPQLTLFALQIANEDFSPGMPPVVGGFALRLDPTMPGAEPELIGFLGDVRVTLEQAGTGSGDVIVGSFSADVY